MTTSPSNKAPSKKTNRKFLGKFLLVVALIVLIPCIVSDIVIRLKFAEINKAITSIQNDVIVPAGGVVHQNAAYSRGNGLIDTISCWPDASCPSASQEWFVPMDTTQEKRAAFVSNLIKQEGYQESNGNGHKGDMTLVIDVNPLGKLKPPTSAPADKIWEFVRVIVY